MTIDYSETVAFFLVQHVRAVVAAQLSVGHLLYRGIYFWQAVAAVPNGDAFSQSFLASAYVVIFVKVGVIGLAMHLVDALVDGLAPLMPSLLLLGRLESVG